MSAPKKAAGGGWLSGALANLESRLDTILADDTDAAVKQRATEAQSQATTSTTDSTKLAAPTSNASTSTSRSPSKSRLNDRLAERLAKATAQKVPSRVSTPVNDAASVRTSGESERLTDVARSVPDISVGDASTGLETDGGKDNVEDSVTREETESLPPLASSALPINPARVSVDSSRPSGDLARDDNSGRPSLDIPNGTHHASKNATELQAEVDQMQSDFAKTEAQRQEEMHVYLERIDALQAKLTYLAKETVAAAKEANAAAAAGTPERGLAEKDEKIALLMEEGEKLSKIDLQRMQTIKKLRSQATEDEKVTSQLRKKLENAERSEADLKVKLRKAQVAERQANEKTKQIALIEKQVEELRGDRENAAELVRSLTTQLKEAREQVEKAEKQNRASEVDKGKIADLQNELEDAQIEKKLAEDRATAEIKKAQEESQRQTERFAVREMELKNEISGLESRLEALRARAEEATSTGGGDGGESSVKLMRQVETLQQQYSLAKNNWETIESSLNGRLATLEKERDEVIRREADLRKKARDVGTRARKAEEQLETTLDRLKTLEEDHRRQQERVDVLQSKLEQSETSHRDSRAEYEKQRKLWESEFSQRLEEEKLKWRKEFLGSNPLSPRPESPASFARKTSGFDMSHRRPMNRLTSHDFLAYADQRPTSKRGSIMPVSTRNHGAAAEPSPSLSRQESIMSFENSMPPTPSIDVDARISEGDDFEDGSSPQRTINDLVSTSVASPAAGPSVQLVERMSALVRKLESEKASFKDELNRLSAQRDDARSEVVELMREVEVKRYGEGKVAELEKELSALKGRYDASLEMLGEKEEEVDELRSDVTELKRIYRELVETKVGGSSGK